MRAGKTIALALLVLLLTQPPLWSAAVALVWKQDVYFASGRPWVDIRAAANGCTGAKGDGAADDTLAIQCAVNAATSGGIVYAPPGHYCIKGGPITVTTNSVRIVVAGQDAVEFDVCGTTGGLFQFGALSGTTQTFRSGISGAFLQGGNTTGVGSDVILFTKNCVECTASDLLIGGGIHSIEVANGSSDTVLTRIKANSAYGSLILDESGSLFLDRAKLDQSYPGATPGANSVASIGTWAATTAYSINTLVQDGNFILQATTGGTSGSSLPTVPAYGSSVTDGSVVWKLVAPATYYAVQMDTGATNLYITRTDMTGPFSRAVGLTNTGAGTAPQNAVIRTSTTGANLYGSIWAHDGSGLTVEDSYFANIVVQGNGAVSTSNNWTADTVISGTLIVSPSAYCVFLGAGANASVVGNLCYNAQTAGLAVAAGISNFSFIANQAGTSATWGTNVVGIQIPAGASGNYSIVGNNVAGATTPLTDAGTGSNRIVQANPGYNPQASGPVTAGASVWTPTADSFPDFWILTAANGISAWTCNGTATTITAGSVCLLPSSGTMSVTWATTAPVFTKVPQ